MSLLTCLKGGGVTAIDGTADAMLESVFVIIAEEDEDEDEEEVTLSAVTAAAS